MSTSNFMASIHQHILVWPKGDANTSFFLAISPGLIRSFLFNTNKVGLLSVTAVAPISNISITCSTLHTFVNIFFTFIYNSCYAKQIDHNYHITGFKNNNSHFTKLNFHSNHIRISSLWRAYELSEQLLMHNARGLGPFPGKLDNYYLKYYWSLTQRRIKGSK